LSWQIPDVDVSLGFSVSSQNGQVRVSHDFARTEVSFGTASGILSLGCTPLVASALETQSDGFLSGFIGPVLAQRLQDAINDDLRRSLDLLNHSVPPPVPYKFYDLTLTEADGLNYRLCPSTRPRPRRPTRRSAAPATWQSCGGRPTEGERLVSEGRAGCVPS
jgi:hypothetical protein